MIELKSDELEFSFPEVHPSARLTIGFQRTLRIPDDAREYPLPPGLGSFPLRHVDDFAPRVPAAWLEHGGVMLPMHQAEAMWLQFDAAYDEAREVEYPCAVRVAAGKINAVTGQLWTAGLHKKPQDYLVVPEQPWLDGFCVEQGTIRQFVAMPLGEGYSAEEQITGEAAHGGVQIEVWPMKREVFERRFPRIRRPRYGDLAAPSAPLCCTSPYPDMGLGAGGKMRQEIYDDPFAFTDWDRAHTARCFVHLANSEVWKAITGQAPPVEPPTAATYTRAGLPWFDWYSETPALQGSPILAGLQTVLELGKTKGATPLPGNDPVEVGNVVHLRKGLAKDQVREGRF